VPCLNIVNLEEDASSLSTDTEYFLSF